MEIYGKTGAKHKSNISLKEKLSNYLIGGNTASNACSMQGYKFERKTFKLLIGGSTCSKI